MKEGSQTEGWVSKKVNIKNIVRLAYLVLFLLMGLLFFISLQ